MNTLYTVFTFLFITLSPLTLLAGDECDCTVSKSGDGATHYSPGCDSPKDVCKLTLGPDLGSIELLQFTDLRDVTVRIGDGTYPSFLSSTLVSAGTYFAIDGTRVSIDIVAFGETVQQIEGLDRLKLLNNSFLDLSVLLCLSLDIDLFGLGDGLGGPCSLGNQIVFPVNLLDWTAATETTGIRLEWSTARERDADYYRVMHSTDGQNFTEIAAITASGTTEDLQTYGIDHASPVAGTNLYRLEQYDFDGTYHDLGLVTADWRPGSDLAVAVWPNPVPRGGELQLSEPLAEGSQVRLIDPLGRCVARFAASGERTLALPATLVRGKYYLQINGHVAPLIVTD